ncbi:MAG: T6SS immunity protein Tdi1 domain-containing protein, partial [Gammaproteobacteria bacterium]
KEPFITTCFGDIFFDSDEGIYFLDSLGGTFEKVASSKSELQGILNTEDGQDHFLMADLAIAAQENGLSLCEGECLDFKVSPILGGPLTVDNLHVMSFKVALDVAGQIMRQVKDLPPGTKIDKVTLDGT